jgi:hypothetical protein
MIVSLGRGGSFLCCSIWPVFCMGAYRSFFGGRRLFANSDTHAMRIGIFPQQVSAKFNLNVLGNASLFNSRRPGGW